MWTTCRKVLLVSVCTLLFLAGCVPIQPETATTAAPPPTDTPTPEPTATPTPEPTVAASVVSDDWGAFVDEARGLSIPVAPGWIFIDPTVEELSDFLSEAGKQTTSDEIKELLAYFISTMQQQEMMVGLALHIGSAGPGDLAFLNNINALVFPTEGLSLSLMVRLTAAQLDEIEGFEVERAEVAVGLRPDGAEVLSILSRVDGALYSQPDTEFVSWQVGLLSPDGATMLFLTCTVAGEQFEELEPVLVEILQRVEWFE